MLLGKTVGMKRFFYRLAHVVFGCILTFGGKVDAQQWATSCDGQSDCSCANHSYAVGSLFRWSDHSGDGDISQPNEPLITDRPDFTSTEHYFNGGFTYLVNNDMQWDIRGGTGLNDTADDYFVGTGVSIRFR